MLQYQVVDNKKRLVSSTSLVVASEGETSYRAAKIILGLLIDKQCDAGDEENETPSQSITRSINDLAEGVSSVFDTLVDGLDIDTVKQVLNARTIVEDLFKEGSVDIVEAYRGNLNTVETAVVSDDERIHMNVNLLLADTPVKVIVEELGLSEQAPEEKHISLAISFDYQWIHTTVEILTD